MSKSSSIILGTTRTQELSDKIAEARARLADIDAAFTSEKAKIDALRARLFFALREAYEKRDEAELYLQSLRILLEELRQKKQNAKAHASQDFENARAESRRKYEEAASELQAKQKLSSDEEKEMHQLWKKLVRLYHPDRFANDPSKLEAYTNLTAAINSAKESGDLETLREIAKDPIAFMQRKGWKSLDFSDSTDAALLEKHLHSLTVQIEIALAELTKLRTSPEYDLLQLIGIREEAFDEAVEKQRHELARQISHFQAETAAVQRNIDRIS
jgi:hypothetical protein